MKYLLLDACIVAGYYLPRSLRSLKAGQRIERILNYSRAKPEEYFCYIPNFCVAEVFSVFMKYTFARWNRHVKRGKKGTIDTRIYKNLCEQFRRDIHNGKFLYHYELSRYHILGVDLVAPIDHYYQISRSGKNINPMGTFDHLLISMGINLASIHGRDNVCIITADDRMTEILSKCKSGSIPEKTITKLKLKKAEEITGRRFGPDVFPKHLNLKNKSKKSYTEFFHEWPLKENKFDKKSVYRFLK